LRIVVTTDDRRTAPGPAASEFPFRTPVKVPKGARLRCRVGVGALAAFEPLLAIRHEHRGKLVTGATTLHHQRVVAAY
jgi:hypothetical protein